MSNPEADNDSEETVESDAVPAGRGSWLDKNELPNLSSVNHHHFDIASEIDLSRYLDILADTTAAGITVATSCLTNMQSESSPIMDTTCDASTAAPLDSAWSS